MATDSKIEDFAEELGRLLGTAEAKAKGWLSQRQQISKTLEGIRDTANKLLGELGTAARAVARGRRGRPPGSGKKRGPGRPKGTGKKRTMSAKARAAISAAQKKRWAKVKAEKK
jgi:hypothetical protein